LDYENKYHFCYKIEKACCRFIQGDNGGKDKNHLIRWKSTCQAKIDGGLGVREMYPMNKAFIVKLGWGIINDSSYLCARVLRGKYIRTKDNIP
jgi:hypothetical protein